MHWAGEYIGLPWSPEGEGPREYSCWGLTRKCFLIRFGVVLPMIAHDTDANFRALSYSARQSGFRPVLDLPRADDVVLMKSRRGERHVGWMVFANGGLRVLHADGYVDEKTKRAIGSVIASTLKEATSHGYGHYEFWRRA